MIRIIAASSVIILLIILLFSYSEKNIEIVSANLPRQADSGSLKGRVWVMSISTKGNTYDHLRDEGSFYLFKSNCDGSGDIEQIGYIVDSPSNIGNKWNFEIDDLHSSKEKYWGIKKGDCILIKTDHTYRIFVTWYRSNIVRIN